jgi:ATP-binding cassette, subfamily B, bacterial
MQVISPKIKRILLSLKLGLNLIWQSCPGWTIGSAVVLFAQGTLPLVSIYLTKLMVDAVIYSVNHTNKFSSFRQVGILICLAGLVALLINLCTSAATIVNQAQSQLVTNHVQDNIHAKAIELDLEYYEDVNYYDMLFRAQQQASSQPTNILNRLVTFAQSSISLLAMSGLLLSLHWSVAFLLFITAVPKVIARFKYASMMYIWKTKRTQIERQAWYLDWILTSNIYSKEIRLFNLGSIFRRRFRSFRKQLHQESLDISTRRSVPELAAQASGTIIMYGSYGFIAYQAVKGKITFGDLAIYQQAFRLGQDYLQNILISLGGLYEDSLFISNLYDFLRLQPKVIEPLDPQTVPNPMQTGIVVNHVSFQYPNSTRNSLEDINLTIFPGEVVALVGENGAGKTSLIKLLCRLYDPAEGSITIDGIDLKQFATKDLRRQISVLFQDYGQYNLSVLDNIWFGNIDLPYDPEKISDAARDANIEQLINQLPYNYNTILGKWVEAGEELSIGQWQKIALARAFLRDSQIIILDEPTSALDPKAEEEVFQKFRQLIKGQAAILISHRLSTVKMADRIYVMEQGRIVESGTHNELMQVGGSYAHLFETQAQNYR